MATIYIDNQPYEVPDGRNLLQTCLSLGLNLPYFCWHPAMGSVGACRQCAVKQFRDENDKRGRLVMACMTPATNGTRISIEDPEAKAFRASVIEWLMLNHPHDCPVCDEGGECHLQDMTVMTGHNYRRTRIKKRTYRNQYLGPFVNHEMNRCIQCYRCVRFYRDYADGKDFNVFASHNHVYFGRTEEGVLQSEFSGNLVEVCPTGVFTDKTLGTHYTRAWDLQTAPSICVGCAVGCNTIPGERYGSIRRMRNRFNGQVNGYFLCDRGRYGYEFVNSERRIRQPLFRPAVVIENQSLRDAARAARQAAAAPSLAPWEAAGYTARGVEEARATAASVLTAEVPGMEIVTVPAAVQRAGQLVAEAKGLIGIGSPRASLEANFALRKLVGPDRFYTGMAAAEAQLVGEILDILQNGPARSPSLAEVRSADSVIVLGEDVTQTAPVLALALRHASRNQPNELAARMKIAPWDDLEVREAVQGARGPLFIASVSDTKLDDIATATYHGAPDDLARLGFAVAEALSAIERAPADGGASGAARSPAQAAVEAVDAGTPDTLDLPETTRSLARRIAAALRVAQHPLVVCGTSLGSAPLIHAAANIAWALRAAGRPAALSYVAPEANTLGVSLLGGGDVTEAARQVREGKADTVIVLENDLYRRADKATIDGLLGSAAHVIAIDSLANDTTRQAEVVLPAATFAEGDGTLVNNEGRAQRFYQVFVPAGSVQESWRWLCDVMVAAGRADLARWHNLDDVAADLAHVVPFFQPILGIAPPASYRIAGMKIAREPARYSGRTAMQANIDVSEPKPPEDPDTVFTFSMEGFQGEPPSALIPRFWAPGWNSAQALNKFQEEVGGALRGGDPGVRLLEPSAGESFAPYRDVPRPFDGQGRRGELLVVPLYHAYGSEELSMLTAGVAELAPEPYLALNPADASELRLGEGAGVAMSLDGVSLRLAVRLDPAMPAGVAGLPAGLPETKSVMLPAWGRPGMG